MHKANLWNFLKNCSDEIRSNEIRIRQELPVYLNDEKARVDPYPHNDIFLQTTVLYSAITLPVGWIQM